MIIFQVEIYVDFSHLGRKKMKNFSDFYIKKGYRLVTFFVGAHGFEPRTLCL